MWVWQDLGPKEHARSMDELGLFPFELSLLLYCVTFNQFRSFSRGLTKALPAMFTNSCKQCCLLISSALFASTLWSAPAGSHRHTDAPDKSALQKRPPSLLRHEGCQGPSPPSAQARMDEMLVGKVSKNKTSNSLSRVIPPEIQLWGPFPSSSLVKETPPISQ